MDHDKRFPQGMWINDGHRVEVGVPGDGQSPEVEISLVHPHDCPYTSHSWGYKEYGCPIYWEQDQVGLTYPGDAQWERKWADVNWDDSIPAEAWLAFWNVRGGDSVLIEYIYYSGYDTYWQEYDWSFTWRPIEIARLHDLR